MFVKGGKPGPGRPKGSKDRYTREGKQAILDAAEHVGEELADAEVKELEKQKLEIDPNMPRGLSAYLVNVARNHPQVMCAMLARMMPIQNETTQTVDVTYHSFEEINNRLRELGLPVGRIYPLLEAKKIDDAEVTDAPHD